MKLGLLALAVTGINTFVVPALFAAADSVSGSFPMPPDGLVSSLTSNSILAWYAWFVTSRVIPKKDKDHQEQVTNLVDTFLTNSREERTQMAAGRGDFVKLLTESREKYEAECERQRDHDRRESDADREFRHKQANDLNVLTNRLIIALAPPDLRRSLDLLASPTRAVEGEVKS